MAYNLETVDAEACRTRHKYACLLEQKKGVSEKSIAYIVYLRRTYQSGSVGL